MIGLTKTVLDELEGLNLFALDREALKEKRSIFDAADDGVPSDACRLGFPGRTQTFRSRVVCYG